MSESSPAPFSNKPPCDREDAIAVLRRLREAGHVAYFAGGCVRDELLGIKPKDYDVATDAPPQRVRELFSSTQAVGAAFGVILVRHRKSVIEVATFRSDGAYLDGRRPSEVRFTNAEEDAKRRDFTINGMFLDPLTNQVIDYVGGREDLQNRTLRAIGVADQRFDEDYLRLLRAIRFAATFELEIEQSTSTAIRARAPQLKQISPERIADELRRVLTLPEAGGDWAWHAMLTEFPGLADVIYRFLPPAPTPEAREQGLKVFEGFSTSTPWPFGTCLAAVTLDWVLLGSDVSVDSLVNALGRQSVQRMNRAVRQSLRISNEESDELVGSLEGLEMLLRHRPVPTAIAKRFLARATARSSRLILTSLSCHIGPTWVSEIEAQLDELSRGSIAPVPLLTGDDLVAVGWKPGPIFKRILDQVFDAQLEDRITSKQQAIELAKSLANQGVA